MSVPEKYASSAVTELIPERLKESKVSEERDIKLFGIYAAMSLMPEESLKLVFILPPRDTLVFQINIILKIMVGVVAFPINQPNV